MQRLQKPQEYPDLFMNNSGIHLRNCKFGLMGETQQQKTKRPNVLLWPPLDIPPTPNALQCYIAKSKRRVICTNW